MSKKKIIIGDNDKGFLSSTASLLSQMGYNVIDTDVSGAGLLRKIRMLNPDVAIVDVTLKGISGFEISDIVEGEGLCPCVITFKNNPSEYILKLQQKRVFAYVQKPISSVSLEYAIENAYSNFKKFIEVELKQKERKMIDKAKGYLIRKYGITEDKAYEYIRKKSMDKCISMYKVSLAIIDIIDEKEK